MALVGPFYTQAEALAACGSSSSSSSSQSNDCPTASIPTLYATSSCEDVPSPLELTGSFSESEATYSGSLSDPLPCFAGLYEITILFTQTENGCEVYASTAGTGPVINTVVTSLNPVLIVLTTEPTNVECCYGGTVTITITS